MSSSNKAWNYHFVCAIFTAAICSAYQMGFNIGVINAPVEAIKQWIKDSYSARYEESPSESKVDLFLALIATALPVGGLVGGFLNKPIAEKLGRKMGLLINMIFVLVGVSLEVCGFYIQSWELLIIGRIIAGINSGIGLGLGLMYLQEISPEEIKGAVSTIFQLTLTFSIMVAQVLGLNSVLGSQQLWVYLFLCKIPPVLIQVVGMFFIPESPKYLLVEKNLERKSRDALEWLRQTDKVDFEIEELKIELEKQKTIAKVKLLEYIYGDPVFRQQFWLGFLLLFAQQFSGINAVFSYSTAMFAKGEFDPQVLTIVLGCINFLVTFVSCFLIEKYGRKPLLLFGNFVMIGSLIALTICALFTSPVVSWIAFTAACIYILGFAIGPGAIPMILVCEMASQSAKPLAVAFGVFWNWFFNIIVVLTFPNLKQLLQSYVFLIYVASLIVSQILTWMYIPETKGKTEDEIQDIFHSRTG
ncbi:solute carrier family 2, facilitated glucose transporter member 1-like [Artemia franciscana]|uniref:solute carrier family 2, facilitated glucose transporter member 1-like n=1 Tax=Artemia franciscana TaxID=6661 RepID=UPI0032DBB19A